MTSKADKLKWLNDLDKEEDIHELLSEVLPELGFDDVYITHERGNRSENGKDLVCSKLDEIEGRKDWLAFVVKKGVVAGKSAVIQDIIAQTADCFDYEYKDVVKGVRFRINKVKVVCNRHFSSEAKTKIEGNKGFERANISFWDAEKLIDLIDKSYPQYWLKGSKPYKKYVERFYERIKVDNISKTLSISDKKLQKVIQCAIEPRILERITKEDGTFSWREKAVSSVVNVPHNTIIVGEPGAGKSTLFKTLSKEVIEQNTLRNNSEFYPIMLKSVELAASGFDLEKCISTYFKSDWNEDLRIDIGDVLKESRCVIFIDALDEIAMKEGKKFALEAINLFFAKYPQIKIICSSRPSDYLFYSSSDLGLNYMSIDPLNRKQVELFLNNYFSDNLRKSQTLLKSLKSTEILEKLPKTPLTIALITILFDEKEVEIPATITDLYQQFVDLLLGKLTPESTIDIIEIGIKHRLLCHLAHYLHSKERQTISRDEFEKLLDEYAKERGQQIDVQNLLDDLVINSGLLFVNEKEEIQFKHLSFQEYFTAYEIFYHRQGEYEIFVKNFNNYWWQNVAIFFGGMSKDSPKLLEEIIKASEPNNFSELLANTTGMGKLLQALYNTSVEKRVWGIDRGLINIEKIARFLVDTEEPSFKVWKKFSKFVLMQIVATVFQESFGSITLVEPLKREFEKLLKEKDNTKNDVDLFYYELRLYFICVILASDEFETFGELRQLVESTRSNDITLFALLDTHVNRLDKILSSAAKDEDFMTAEKKLIRKRRSIGDIAERVNAPLEKPSTATDKSDSSSDVVDVTS